MISHELQSLIKQLEIISKKMVSGSLQSDVKSSIKGTGFEFHQLRDYIQGDDIRFIDWKASSRSNKMLVRQYLEDRNRTVYIVVDVSGSTFYSTVPGELKSDLMKQLAGLLSFISFYKGDGVGLILFSDEIEKVVPPGTSRSHVLSLIQTIFSYKPRKRTTNLNVAFEYLARLKGKGSIICFLSDFLSTFDQHLLTVAARYHDLLVLRCLDVREREFPYVGTLIFEDAETGEKREISNASLSNELALWHNQQKDRLRSAKVDSLDIEVGKQYTGSLARFLRQRM